MWIDLGYVDECFWVLILYETQSTLPGASPFVITWSVFKQSEYQSCLIFGLISFSSLSSFGPSFPSLKQSFLSLGTSLSSLDLPFLPLDLPLVLLYLSFDLPFIPLDILSILFSSSGPSAHSFSGPSFPSVFPFFPSFLSFCSSFRPLLPSL